MNRTAALTTEGVHALKLVPPLAAPMFACDKQSSSWNPSAQPLPLVYGLQEVKEVRTQGVKAS
jgi:hypothetical protein